MEEELTKEWDKTFSKSDKIAHFRYFCEDTFKKLKGNNKELMIVPRAVHTDLYDHMDIIPFDKIEIFLRNIF